MKISLPDKLHIPKDNLNFRRRRVSIDKAKVLKRVLIVFSFLAVIALGYLCAAFFGNRYTVCDNSMSTTLLYQDSVLIDTFRYRFLSPDANEVIAFYPKGDFSEDISIKRVIGQPGDTVAISRGRIYLNGEEYADTVIADSIDYAGLAADGITLGEDEYFVLGDNRNNSQDSRYPACGVVKREYIIGKVWIDLTSTNFRLIY